MVKFVVMYGQPDDSAAFDEHYAGTHIPPVPRISIQAFCASAEKVKRCWRASKCATERSLG